MKAAHVGFAFAGVLALAGCSDKRTAEVDTGTATAEVTTEAPASAVTDAQLQEQAQQAATAASTPVDGSGPIKTTAPAPNSANLAVNPAQPPVRASLSQLSEDANKDDPTAADASIARTQAQVAKRNATIAKNAADDPTAKAAAESAAQAADVAARAAAAAAKRAEAR